MIIQLDTNILARIAQPSHPQHISAATATQNLHRQGHSLCILPQNLFEFWAVATRPVSVNGLGLTVIEAKLELDKIKSAFVLRDDPPALLNEWEKLVITYDCKGKVARDARIVAAMNLHGVIQILTFNAGDFTRYTGIIVLDPQQIAVAP